MRCAPLVVVSAVLFSCSKSHEAPPPAASSAADAPAPVSRVDWNRFGLRLNLPVFWRADTNGNGVADPDEIAPLLFYPASDTVDLARANDAIVAFPTILPNPSLIPEAARRRDLVGRDLDGGRLTLVETDMRAASPQDKALLAHMLKAAAALDDLYGTMRGMKPLMGQVPPDDVASHSLFRRDWGPTCACAKTQSDPACSAIPGAPRPRADAYPSDLQGDAGDFCAQIEATAALRDHFSVVREQDGKLVSSPYTQAYPGPMQAIAAELRAASADETDPGEAALEAYLDAAATSFTTNDWAPADEAWSRMNARNSRFYLRIAPDEVLADPCKLKAQFHMTFAHVDPASLAWQAKLTPVEADMERALASLIGPPYAPREVTFHLPDFIDIIFNAGDDRKPVGAVAGESLPNWGKVADEGRGRTVAMVNIGQDDDSLAMRRQQVQSLLDDAAMGSWSDDPQGALLGTILHEATHNLGPTSVYAVHGKPPEVLFGGKLASMLEELKAETGAMFYLDWLRQRGIVTAAEQSHAYAAWLAWSMRHVAAGVRSGSDDEAYGQLAAIQLGFAIDQGALTWDAAAPASNGTDHGAFSVHYDRFPATFGKLMKTVGTIKATGDKAGAQALVARYVDGSVVPLATIAERVLRLPQSTVVYAVRR